MATVNICERDGCETFIKGRALGGITLVLSSDNRANPADNIIRMEICPGCVGDVYAAITGKPVTPRERSYSDPFNPSGGTGDKFDALNAATTEELVTMLTTRILADPNARKSIEGRTE